MAFPLKLVEPWKLVLPQQGWSSFVPVQRCVTSIFFKQGCSEGLRDPWAWCSLTVCVSWPCVLLPCSDRWESQCPWWSQGWRWQMCCWLPVCWGDAGDPCVLPTQGGFLSVSWVSGTQGCVKLHWLYPEVFEVFCPNVKSKTCEGGVGMSPPFPKKAKRNTIEELISS